MFEFTKKTLLFLCPLLVCLGLPFYILWKSKENYHTIDSIVTKKEKYLVGYAFNEQNYNFLKWTYLNSNENKTIWALGSSRVLPFRKNMFDVSFYNAGYTITSINDFKPFLQSLPKEKLPKYLILGLDQWMFNASFDALDKTPKVTSWQNSFTAIPKIFPTFQTVYEDLYHKKYHLSNLKEDNFICKIGLNAVINNTGFVNDGSMYYGGQITKLINNDTTAIDYQYSNTLDRIKQGNRRFQYGKSVNEIALIKLNEFLKYCKVNQINVIAFLPPFADKVYNTMNESNNYAYLKEIYTKIKPTFDSYNYEIYDFSSVTSCNSNDNETIDGFHGGEVTYQKMLIIMLEKSSVLNKVTNIQKLKTDLINKKNNYVIYE